MSTEPDDANDERAVMVLPPLPVVRGSFALLVPGNTRWEVTASSSTSKRRIRSRSRRNPASSVSQEHGCRAT